jgi:hypothetical protein
MHEKSLEFGRIHENKIYFCIFLNEEFFYFKKIQRKLSIFNTGYVSYSVSPQPNIK